MPKTYVRPALRPKTVSEMRAQVGELPLDIELEVKRFKNRIDDVLEEFSIPSEAELERRALQVDRLCQEITLQLKEVDGRFLQNLSLSTQLARLEQLKADANKHVNQLGRNRKRRLLRFFPSRWAGICMGSAILLLTLGAGMGVLQNGRNAVTPSATGTTEQPNQAR